MNAVEEKRGEREAPMELHGEFQLEFRMEFASLGGRLVGAYSERM